MFVALSGVLYVILGVLDYSIDEQLRVLASDFGHAIDLDGTKPHFRDWLRVVKTEPARSLAAIELFGADGVLLEHYGPPGPSSLIRSPDQIKNFRVLVSPLTQNLRTVGFLQLAMPTAYRDDALQKLEYTLVLLAPFLLCGLGVTSYIVSDAATAPIQENLNMLKQFLADASHELNTPLSILQARAELLEKKLRRSNSELEDIQVMSSATERMEKIVSDLMLLAEIEGSMIDDAPETSPLDHVLKQVADEFQPKFQQKGIALEQGDYPAVSVCASEECLHKIVSNLIENAWRYTETGGKVSISAGAEGQFAKIQVEDNGIGIPEHSIAQVFDRFYRVDKSRSRASGGSGLGLSIVKALVDSHKGRVDVTSKLGEGSKFSVFLRISP
jgi:signal transduction histidine kinase